MSQILESPEKQIEKLQMEREKLLTSTQRFKSALEGQVSDLKENAMRWGIQAAVFGGVALSTFLIVRAFSGKKKKKHHGQEVAKTSFSSTLFASIQSYIISFLLAVAKEQLIAYLEKTLIKKDAHPKEPAREAI